MDSKNCHNVRKEVNDIELSTSNNKTNEIIQQLVEPLVDNKCDVANKKNSFEENQNENSLRETSFSIFNSTTLSEATTSQDNILISSNDSEPSSPSSNQNKCKRSISKAQVDDDNCDDSNIFNEESSKHQKLNENVCNKSKSENKSVDNAQLVKDSCEETIEDVEMRSEIEEAAALRETKNHEEGLEIDNDSSHAGYVEKPLLSNVTEQDLRQLEESLLSNDSNFDTEQTASEEESEESEPDTPACLKKKRPKPTWFVVPELLHREMGINPSFQRRYYGSLHVVEHFELMYKLKEHEGCVNALNFNKKGNLLASGSDDLYVVIWDWAIGKKHHSFASGHRSNMFQAKWLPFDEENLMATCARDGQVRLLDIRRGVSRKLATHNAPTHKLALHPDTPHVIVSVGEDAKVLSIDIREEKPTKLLVVRDGSFHVQLYSVHCNPLKSNEFCVAGRSQWVRVYDRRNVSKPIHELCPSHLTEKKHVHVTCALYNYDGTEVLASYNDEDIYLFDAISPQPGDFAHKYEGHRNNATVKGVNFFGPKSEFVISGSDCGNIFIWDKNTEAIVNWMPGDEQGVVNCLEPHPHIPILATSGLDCDVKVWAPSCEDPPSLQKIENVPLIEKCVTSNAMNRAQETTTESDAFDSQMLWILLRHIRHTERVRLNLNVRRVSSDQNQDDDDEDDDDNIDDSSDDESSDHSDSQSEGDGIRRLQCPPS
ncbi:DDB1- and CUL4-associated factor 8-like isoform X1 [Bombus pyrosoma]|uniref:DDB1- and CUL4-associated factor 8-like isoform X1 n=1 Tax=Bombus pyrosoma TaxID=396416 RepID=UPI001CB92752|nr:DDB1- and CUL4-associated factor 8-like isoform X1 [Bombus pyrosoma]XP_043580890.1 DDB1- and CUL4-associated factor 8-like isoform X1 [Bombus pyrosoma]XP_043580891.1 DDB1- and CUL4-associated factor 8-like isoform X1 [Bombus pyrosoma]XP_043580892.1 DDB1- and CUL4-associated factor 8-like isoform X1 [Bombus pyrosoma]